MSIEKRIVPEEFEEILPIVIRTIDTLREMSAPVDSPIRDRENELYYAMGLLEKCHEPMTKDAAQEWLQNSYCDYGDYEGEFFLIVDSWDTVNDPLFEERLAVLEIKDWGFNDEYTTCDCGKVIRTEPDSYSWTPEFWLSESEGYLCLECVEKDPTDYLEEVINHDRNFLFDPADYGFTEIIHGIENGWHHGMNDDPRPLCTWAKKNNLEFVFTVHPSQFYLEFDVWARKPIDEVDQDESERVLTDAEAKSIEEALTEDDVYGGQVLRKEFKQWPTPAQVMQEALKHPKVVHITPEQFIKGLPKNTEGGVTKYIIDYDKEEEDAS